VGLNVAVQGLIKHPGVRILPLDDFERMELCMVWHGEPSPTVRALVSEM
jgi:hypothetical protein